MRDRRDYTIAVLGAALLFCIGLLLGRHLSVLPEASAQDSTAPGTVPAQPANSGGVSVSTPQGGIVLKNDNMPQTAGRGYYAGSAPTASDSNSNNRFVAVTTPIGSGESVVFVLDSQTEQLCVYRFVRNKGLQLVAGRKIDYDLKMSAFNDFSDYSRDQLRALYQRQVAKVAAAEAAKKK